MKESSTIPLYFCLRGFMITLFISIICVNLRNLRLLKMQNKAKLKIAKIHVIHFTQRINKRGASGPKSKNKPKQTQTLNVTPASCRQLKTKNSVNPVILSSKKMTNEPNFEIDKNTVSDFILRTKDYIRWTVSKKNEPKQTQTIDIENTERLY